MGDLEPGTALAVSRARSVAPGPQAFPGGVPCCIPRPCHRRGAIPYGDGTPVIPAVRGSGAIRAGAGVGIGRYFRLTAGTAFNIYDQDRVRLPTDFGAAVALPGIPVTFGGGPELTWERCTLDCGKPFRALHVGGAGGRASTTGTTARPRGRKPGPPYPTWCRPPAVWAWRCRCDSPPRPLAWLHVLLRGHGV